MTKLYSNIYFQITLGYKQYQYACLTYTDPSGAKTFALIVGLTVGLSGLALFLTILIVGILSCRRKTGSIEGERRQNAGRQEFGNQQYIAHHNDNEEPEPHQDYANGGQQYAAAIRPNKEYLSAFDEF